MGLTTNGWGGDEERDGVNIFADLFKICDATTSIAELAPTELELALR